MNSEEENTAKHEVGHAIAYWLLTGRFPSIAVNGLDGHCEGDDRILTREDNLFYTLAGFAAEGDLIALDLVPSKCHGRDFSQARQLIRAIESSDLDGAMSETAINSLMHEAFGEACDRLYPESHRIDAIVGILRQKRLDHPNMESASVDQSDVAWALSPEFEGDCVDDDR